MEKSLEKLIDFLSLKDEKGLTNLDKIAKKQKILRRTEKTDKSLSVEEVESNGEPQSGIVMEDGKIIGLGIHILNEDVYPLKYFELYLRNCDLTGNLDISGCKDMIYVDLYYNKITSIETKNLPAMRVFGVQDNLLESIDLSGMTACQGIDVGVNKLRKIDVTKNTELIELYVNDNNLKKIVLSNNRKLKYFYCQNNHITELDTRSNPLLRHLNATNNPMKSIKALAPQRERALPLEVSAGTGGCVGLKFYPVYNAQWKETKEWKQSYHAYPDDGYSFAGWYQNGKKVSDEENWVDEYGVSRILEAHFDKN